MPAKVGKVMIEMLHSLDTKGPQTYQEVWANVKPDWQPIFVSTYLIRAMKLGLVTHDDERPRKYSTVADWRESDYVRRDEPKRKAKIAVPQVPKLSAKAVNSVFALGGL